MGLVVLEVLDFFFIYLGRLPVIEAPAGRRCSGIRNAALDATASRRVDFSWIGFGHIPLVLCFIATRITKIPILDPSAPATKPVAGASAPSRAAAASAPRGAFGKWPLYVSRPVLLVT